MRSAAGFQLMILPLQVPGDNGQRGGLHQGPQPVIGFLQGLRRLLARGDIPGHGGEELHLTLGVFMGNDHLGRGDFLTAAAPERGFPAPDLVAQGLDVAMVSRMNR